MKEQATITISTWYRQSTEEWLGVIDFETPTTSGSASYSGATEDEARNAAFAAIGYNLLSTTFKD